MLTAGCLPELLLNVQTDMLTMLFRTGEVLRLECQKGTIRHVESNRKYQALWKNRKSHHSPFVAPQEVSILVAMLESKSFNA
jgi:hypothetical protein